VCRLCTRQDSISQAHSLSRMTTPKHAALSARSRPAGPAALVPRYTCVDALVCSVSSSSSGPRFPKGPTARSAEMCMRRRVASAASGPSWAVLVRTAPCSSCVARARPALGPAAGGASWNRACGSMCLNVTFVQCENGKSIIPIDGA
jgi:hypothetical protein